MLLPPPVCCCWRYCFSLISIFMRQTKQTMQGGYKLHTNRKYHFQFWAFIIIGRSSKGQKLSFFVLSSTYHVSFALVLLKVETYAVTKLHDTANKVVWHDSKMTLWQSVLEVIVVYVYLNFIIPKIHINLLITTLTAKQQCQRQCTNCVSCTRFIILQTTCWPKISL